MLSRSSTGYTVESPADMVALINQLHSGQTHDVPERDERTQVGLSQAQGNAQHMPYPHTSGDRQTQKDPNELGALWEKQSPSGETYYSGEINGQRVVVFPVKKRSERGPALRVLKSTAQGQGTQSQRQAPLARASRPTVEDIPF